MMIDMKTTANCPRLMVYTDDYGDHLVCKQMPIPLGLTNQEFKDHPELYTRRDIVVADCEACLGKELPNLRKQFVTYAKTVTKWVSKGGKERSEEEVERIWNICKQCDALVDDRCRDCGCRIGKGGRPLTNKLKMDTTHCIRGLW